MFKVNIKNTRTTSGVFTVNFEHISHLFLVFFVVVVDFEQANVRMNLSLDCLYC